MTREEFVKQRCEIDKITLEKFDEQYRVVECNCGQPYCKGYRCLDLDGLLKETQELKNQLEKLDKKLFFTENELDMREKSIDNKLNQQKEFKKYLKDMLDDENDIFSVVRVKDVLQKYKEITGISNGKES